MKTLMTLGLVLGTVAFGGQAATNNKQKESSNIQPKATKLELSISSDRHRYKQHGKIKITVMLTNGDYVKDLFVYGTLGWGHLSSLTYTIRDASGKFVQPTILADDLPFPLAPDDTTSFVKLAPNHFLGTSYSETLDRLNLRKPGKYSILVEYHCPISSAGVNLSNFWSKEHGTIGSNLVHIEVLP
jgi:hypothetical protein